MASPDSSFNAPTPSQQPLNPSTGPESIRESAAATPAPLPPLPAVMPTVGSPVVPPSIPSAVQADATLPLERQVLQTPVRDAPAYAAAAERMEAIAEEAYEGLDPNNPEHADLFQDIDGADAEAWDDMPFAEEAELGAMPVAPSPESDVKRVVPQSSDPTPDAPIESTRRSPTIDPESLW